MSSSSQTVICEQAVDIIPELVTRLRSSPPELRLIRVEGTEGAGKSTFAKALGAQLDAQVFHGDEYITRKNTGEPYRELSTAANSKM